MTVVATIDHYTDATLTTKATITQSVSFQVDIIDPCLVTVLDPPTIQDMYYTVKEAGYLQLLIDP